MKCTIPIAAFISGLALTGCDAVRFGEGPYQDWNMNRFHNTCTNFGYAQGTEGYGDCMIRQHQLDQQQNAVITQQGIQLLEQSQPQPQVRPVQSNCHWVGNVWYCTTW